MAHTKIKKNGLRGEGIQVRSGRCKCGEQPLAADYELEIHRGMQAWGTAEFERHTLAECVHYKQVDAKRVAFLERVEAAVRAYAELASKVP